MIGQQFVGRALTLGFLLVVGFALHNATEGFGIAAPLANEKKSIPYLLLLGLIGGGPTFLGTVVGTRWTSPLIGSLFLAVAAGAILYIVGELIHLGRLRGGHFTATLGLLFGFFVAFGSDLVIERAMTVSLLKEADEKEIRMAAGDFFFEPRTVHLPLGRPVKVSIENHGEAEHEIEVLGMGEEIEQAIPPHEKAWILLSPRQKGVFPFICDMPGHLAQGMKGDFVVY